MFAFLPSLPGFSNLGDEVRALADRVDTARHHGIPNGCVLEFNLRSVPPETTGFDPLTVITGGGRPMALRDAVTAIHRAAQDPRVAGLIAHVQLEASAAAAVQELREAIANFSAVKPSVAWAETYPGTLSYYLASAFGEVWMQPAGSVGLIGFSSNATFLRDALDKAGIKAQFVARGEYKSAANLFTQDRYTDAHREADTRLLESLRAQVWQGIAESRKVGIDALDGLADQAPLLRDLAVESGLIDGIVKGFLSKPDEELEFRLLAALEGGRDAGGQVGKDGHLPERSAALYVASEPDHPDIDVRVDLHPEAIGEVRRILEEFKLYEVFYRERGHRPDLAMSQGEFVATLAKHQ